MLWKRLLTGNLAPPLFCLAAMAANQSIFRLGAMPFAVAVLAIAAVAAVAIMAPDVRPEAPHRERFGWLNLLLGAVILAPLLASFALGVDRDFPFSGDHYFHVGQAYRIAFWWLSPPGSAVVRVPTLEDVSALLKHPIGLAMSRAVLAAVIVLATALLYRRQRVAALAFATVAIIAWGLTEHTIFVRYPGAGYLATMPLLGPAVLLRNVELAGRLTNVLAPVLWLFVLRPWLIGRWPDLRVLAFGVLLFWQQDVIYFFDSVYMEPWAVTLCLLAIELLIVRGASGAPLACLLIGAAATVKEPVIFALPLVWLAGAPWQKVRRQDWPDFWKLSGCALAAGAPFVLYFAARGSVAAEGIEASRAFQAGLPPGPYWPYAEEFAHRVMASFSAGGIVLFGVALLLMLAMIVRRRAERLVLVCLLATGLLLVAFFFIDRGSLAWLGSFRFLLPALPFLAAGALAFGETAAPRWAATAAAVVVLLQAPNAATALMRAAGPISGLNFIEHYDAAIFFPMKSLLAEARAKGLLLPGETVRANAPDTSLRAIPGLPVTYTPPGELVCECTLEHPATMVLFVRYANLTRAPAQPGAPAGLFGPPPDREPLWRAANAARPACLARLAATCPHVLQRVEDGEAVAALGLGR